MTKRPCSLPLLACVFALAAAHPLAADAPPSPPTTSDPALALDRAVARGIFSVVQDAGVTLAIIGPAWDGLGHGPVRRLDVPRGRSDLIVAGQALGPRHPASLDTLPRRALRIATHDGFCTARLGRMFVVDIASRGTLNTHRDAPMLSSEEAAEVWERGAYVAAPIERGCPGAVLATIHVAGTPARASVHTLSPAELSQAELAFAGSHAARAASSFRTGGHDAGGSIDVVAFAFGGARTISIVSEFLPDIWHCSGAQSVFPMILEHRGGQMRTVRMPELSYSVGPGSLVLDIDGDGVVEMVFEHEGTTTVYELRPDADDLTLLGGFSVNYSIGC